MTKLVKDPLKVQEIESVLIMLRCITDDFIDYVQIQDGELNEATENVNIREIVQQLC